MAKTKGKNSPLVINDDPRFETMHAALAEQRRTQVVQVNMQSYVDNMAAEQKLYMSATQKIQENLKTAEQGLQKIDEKGMTDKIIEAIEKVSEIRRKQIACDSKHITNIAEHDSNFTKGIREQGDYHDTFVVDQLEEKIKQKNAEMQEELALLDEQYSLVESNLHKDRNGNHCDKPADADLIEARRQQDSILAEKQKVMADYAMFLWDVAEDRERLLFVKEDREEASSEAQETKDHPDRAQDEEDTPESVSEKESKIFSAFENATEKARPHWDKFKSLPVISGLVAGGAAVGRNVSSKFDTWKSDIVAGYAVMKERKQIRKAERVLSNLDELQSNDGTGSYMSKFKDVLNHNADPEVEVSHDEDLPIEPTPEPEPEQEPEVTELPEDTVEPESVPDEPKESLHDSRIRKAENQAMLQALESTGLRKMINDYYWTDVTEAHDILDELSSSDNVMTDLAQYTGKIKSMISHWPNERLCEAMTQKIDNAMTEVYHAKDTSHKKVLAAEARIKDSEEFLRSLDENGSVDAKDFDQPEQ